MLYINLLPEPKKAITRGPPRFTFLLVLSLILLVVGGYYLQTRLNAEIERLEEVRQNKQETKQELQQKVAEVNSIQKQMNQLEKEIEIIKDVRTKQKMPLHYLNSLLTSLPPEKIWLNSLDMQSNKNIQIQGIALDNQAFAEFSQNIRNTEYFRDVTLSQTSRKDIANLHLVSFQCTLITQ